MSNQQLQGRSSLLALSFCFTVQALPGSKSILNKFSFNHELGLLIEFTLVSMNFELLEDFLQHVKLFKKLRFLILGRKVLSVSHISKYSIINL